MARVILFGIGQLADVAHFYLKHDSSHEVVGFTVDRAYLREPEHSGLPVVAFEEVERAYPPSEFEMFVPVSYRQVNRVREAKYHEAKKKGYRLISYVSSRLTKWPGLEMGDNCFFLEDNTIQPHVKIGNNVILWSGNHIGHHTIIEDHVYIASQVVISGAVRIGARTFIGVNATLRDNITIGADCVLGAGAVILHDTAPRDVFVATEATKIAKKSDELKRI